MKKLLYIVGGLVVVVVVAIVALITLVNPNQFKPLIADQFESNTGMTITLEGDINWRFFPSLGLSIDKMYIDNPADFSDRKLLSVDKVGVGVQVLPLLDKQLFVEQVELANASFSLETLNDGRTNLDAFTATNDESASEATDSEESVESPAPSEPQSSDTPWTIEVAGVSITDSQLQVTDAQAGTNLLLENFNLTLTEFGFDKWSQLALSVEGTHNNQQFSASLDTGLWLDAELAFPQLKGFSLTSTYRDPSVEVSPLKLTIDQFELNQWAPVALESTLISGGNTVKVELGLELLLEGDLSQYQLRNISMASNVNGDDVSISNFDMSMPTFGYNVANPVSISLKGNASGVSFDNQLSMQLWIDEAMSAIKLDSLSLTSTLQGDTLPYSPMKMSWQGGIDYDVNGSQSTVTFAPFSIDEMVFNGHVAADISQAIPNITYLLTSDNVDLDAFMAKGESAESAATQDTAQSTSDEEQDAAEVVAQEPDLAALSQVHVAGRTEFGRFKASNILMTNLKTDVAVTDGVAKVKSITAALYEGSLKLSATLNAQQATPTYSGDVALTKVQAKPLLVAVADTDLIEGLATTTTTFSGSSLIPDNLMKNLIGVANVSFTDGAINGINLAQIIRDNYAKIKGQSSAHQSEVKKTDFSALSGEFKFDKGNVTTDDFAMQSPLLRVTAQGQANYIQQNIDALTKVSIVGTLEGQGGDDINDLKDLTIPLSIRGPWSDPKFGLDFAALQAQELERNKAKLEEKAKKEAERGLKKLLGDKAEDDEVKKLSDKLLKGLFN
jgi:AsmA protein